ncbi:hypothetical protein [Dyella mobilis]|uniref:Uncharacterized protein n=1 Tax=Dyella mobilis TaxID=1849582 RepID=A0ABS2KL13_9GAMM|nr:hypothetical protein [Dyella mobilis]MBM7131853.1 hypothetical protein [Dyella mobilis]GLQ96167.1 hypothetical protein GCM10007863_05850 [Dyella mobilis]
MSVVWTVLGTIVQLMLAPFLFMLVVFSASSIADAGTVETGILNLSIFLLPALCVVSGLIVIYLHWRRRGAASYWWYGMPVVGTAAYLAYAIHLAHQVAQ